MRKTLMISAVLALGLGAASAQTAPTTNAQVTLSDVPAGHWAKDAVDKIVSCGLIQGFPDGTFRGNENLTRYQAALIFHRLLTTDALSKCGFGTGDMTTIVNGMQEVSTELAAISARVDTLEKANADQAARISALEDKITALGDGGSNVDVTALNARIDALETEIKNIPAGPQGPKGDKGDKGDTGAAATGTSTTVVTTPVTTTPGTTVVIGDVTPVMSAKNYYAGITAGVKMTDKATKPCVTGRGPKYDTSGNITNTTSYCMTAGGVIGAKSLFGPIGARISADYIPGWNGFTADVAATYSLDMGTGLGAYVGAGLGLTSGKLADALLKAGNTKTTTDTYALGLVGVEYRITDSIAAFVEGNGRYYLTNKGYNTGLASSINSSYVDANAAKKGFNLAAKAGVKFYF